MPTPASLSESRRGIRAIVVRQPASRLLLLLFAGALALVSLQALAHHGWAWAEEEQSQIRGAIEEISMAPPHPVLRVKTSDGALWQVDLGNPNQTARSGFTGDSAQVGDTVTVLGNRSRKGDPHMKAVRITIEGQNYDMYPERIEKE